MSVICIYYKYFYIIFINNYKRKNICKDNAISLQEYTGKYIYMSDFQIKANFDFVNVKDFFLIC